MLAQGKHHAEKLMCPRVRSLSFRSHVNGLVLPQMRKPRHRAVSSGADANQESPVLALLLKESPGILGSTFGGVSMCGLER